MMQKHHLKESEFTASILDKEKFPASFKYEILAFLIKAHYSEYTHIIEVYDKLIKKRNRFAHDKFINHGYTNADKDAIIFISQKTENGKASTKGAIIDDKYMREFYGEYFGIYSALLELEKLTVQIKREQ